MSIKIKIQNLIDAGNEVTGYDDENLTDVFQALIDGYGGGTKRWYSHYMSHISPFDGFYSSHSYDAVFIKDGYLYVFYTHAPHHFTSKTDASASLMLCKYDLANRQVVSNTVILNPARCFWHGVQVEDTYYLFAESGTKYRLATTDFETYTETTWSAPSSFSNMNYICVGANNRLICTTGRTVKGCNIFYSDDLGLNWVKASGYADAVTTHGGFVHLGNGKIVLYCQDRYTGSSGSGPIENAHDTQRVVMISEDNGETWTGSLCQNADLLDCGVTYSSGAFCKVDDTWFFGTNARFIEQQSDGYWHLGNIRLFKGTEEDVINGSMSLVTVVDDFNSYGTARTSMTPSTVQSDSGNMCMRTDGTNLYLVYHKPVLHADSADIYESNSMLALAIVDNARRGGLEDDFYDPGWETERDAFIQTVDTNHDLYAWGMSRNIGSGVYDEEDQEIVSGDIIPISGLKIPFTNEFYFKMVVAAGANTINTVRTETCIGVGIDSKVYALVGDVFNRTAGQGGMIFQGKSNSKEYFCMSYKNGKLSVKLNGRTIDDLKCPMFLNPPELDNNYITISFGDMETYFNDKTSTSKNSGIQALVIDTDGDVSSFLEWPITYNGENCTFSNNATSGKYNYICKITPDDGYEINTLKYIMGGVEHIVTGDTVSITEITGKLTIVADIIEEDLQLTTDGLVAYYDIGDSAKIDTDGTAHSLINDSDHVAWTGSSNLSGNKSQASKPTVFANGYASQPGGMQIILGQTLANLAQSDSVTIEYLFASSYANFSGVINAGTKSSPAASVGNVWSIGYQGGLPSNRIFTHRVLVVTDTGVSIWVNGTFYRTVTGTNRLTPNTIGVGGNSNERLGHVRVYNKAMTEAEITNNYKYFRTYNKVGQTAFDSDGNYVGG